MGLSVIDPNIKLSLQTFGQTIIHYPSRICSCVGENNGVPRLDHTCIQGFYFDTPETIIGIRTAVSYKLLNTSFGRALNGGATFTIPRLNLSNVEQQCWKKIARGDILALENKTRRDTDILIRGTRDVLYAFNVSEILSIYRNNTKYELTEDYTLSETTTSAAAKLMQINWVTDKGPATGETYSVEFTCKQQYKVWDDGGQDRGTDVDQLPKKVIAVLRRFINPAPIPLTNIEIDTDIYQ
jgi:hypothetical protein